MKILSPQFLQRICYAYLLQIIIPAEVHIYNRCSSVAILHYDFITAMKFALQLKGYSFIFITEGTFFLVGLLVDDLEMN